MLVDLGDLSLWVNHSYAKLLFLRMDKQALILRKFFFFLMSKKTIMEIYKVHSMMNLLV